MKTILAIAASARRKGNSDTLLERALEPMRQAGCSVQIIIPRELSITPCRACNGCWQTGRCVVQDEMQHLYAKFCQADHVVVASPIYFTSLPGHFKILIDRFQCFWVRTFRLGEPPQPRRTGMFLCVGAMDRDRYFKGCLTTVKTWMAVLNKGLPYDRQDVDGRAEHAVRREPLLPRAGRKRRGSCAGGLPAGRRRGRQGTY